MKTKYIPAVIMLTAGLITSIIGIRNNFELIYFLTSLLVVLLIFAIIGKITQLCIIKIITKTDKDEEQQEAVLDEDNADDMEAEE